MRKLVKKVKKHREARMVTLDKFVEMSKQPGVIILDTRSDSMYNAKHIKGAIHLNFSDFTEKNLAALIPNKNTKILIYCNNNFSDDQGNFPYKICGASYTCSTADHTCIEYSYLYQFVWLWLSQCVWTFTNSIYKKL